MQIQTPEVSFKDRSVHEIHLRNGYTYVIEQNLKHFTSVINVLAKFSEQILLQPTDNSLVLSASSSARSAYAKVKLSRQFFDQLRARENLAADGEVFCRLATKSLVHIFRNAAHPIVSVVPSCSIELDPASDFAYVHLQCASSIRRCFVLSLREHAVVCDNVFNERQRLKNRVTAHAKMLATLLGPLDCSDLELIALPGQFTACRYIPREEYGKVRRTEVQIPIDHCEQYHIHVPTRVVVNLRELRPILQFADLCGMSVTLHFDRAGRPLIVAVEDNVDFAAEFVLGTLDEPLPLPANVQQQQPLNNNIGEQQRQQQSQVVAMNRTEVSSNDDEQPPPGSNQQQRRLVNNDAVRTPSAADEERRAHTAAEMSMNIDPPPPFTPERTAAEVTNNEPPLSPVHVRLTQNHAVPNNEPALSPVHERLASNRAEGPNNELPFSPLQVLNNEPLWSPAHIRLTPNHAVPNNEPPLSPVHELHASIRVEVPNNEPPLSPVHERHASIRVEVPNNEPPLSPVHERLTPSPQASSIQYSPGQLLQRPGPTLEFVDPNEIPLERYMQIQPFQRLSVVPRPEGMSVWEQDSDVGSRAQSSIISSLTGGPRGRQDGAGGGKAQRKSAAVPVATRGGGEWMSKRSASQRRNTTDGGGGG